MDKLLARLGTLIDAKTGTTWSPKELSDETLSAMKNERLHDKLVVINQIDDPFHFLTTLLAALLCQKSVLIDDTYSDDHQNENLPSRPSLILKTSGTTGRPKYIVHQWENLLAKIDFLAQLIPADELERSACLLRLSFGHGLIGCFLLPLLNCKTVIFFKPELASYLNFAQLAHQHKITFLSATPQIYQLIEKGFKNHPEITSLKRIQTASSFSSTQTLKFMRSLNSHARLYQAYGLTELMSWISFYEIKDSEEAHPHTIQVPPETDWLLINNDQSLSTTNEGELALKSPFVCEHNSQCSYVTFDQNVYLRTKDWVTYDQIHQSFTLLGRTDDLIDYQGLKFYPQEVEDFIRKELQLSTNIILFYQDKLTLAVESAFDLNLEKKIKEVINKIPEQKKPTSIVFQEKFQTTSNGKISRKDFQHG